MVAVAILSLFTLFLFRSDTGLHRERSVMRDYLVEITNLLSNARSMAINSSSVTELGGTVSVIPKYGYGVNINLVLDDLDLSVKGSKYTLFADTNDNGDGTYGNGYFDSGDSIIGEPLILFDTGIYQATEVDIFVTDGTAPKTMTHSGLDTQLTVFFKPLTAEPLILFNNIDDDADGDNDIGTSPYTDMAIKAMLPGRLEEVIELNTVGGFFTRNQISLTPTPTP